MKIKIKRLHSDAKLPEYKSEGASGFDLYALDQVTVEPGCTMQVKTGLSFEIPFGTELQIRPRSGNSLKTKIRVANSPGTVDSDFTGEVQVIVDNIGTELYVVQKGDRIAQGVLVPVFRAEIEEVSAITATKRGNGGFGSTGR